MNWYYVDQGKQAGPVDEAELDRLRASGAVQDETLIWREGMPNWAPYREARGGSIPSSNPIPPSTSSVSGAQAVCAECGRMFPTEDMIRHGTAHVCAGCKPVFMQKLAEGARINLGQLNYAGFWTRFAAVFIDGILLWIVNFGIGLVAGLSAAQASGIEEGAALALQLVLMFVQLAIGISYEVIMIGKYGATLGKMAMKIQVVTAEGGKVSYMRALGRYFAKFLSGIICLVGYIMAAFDEERRALHDRICNTRVVVKS